MTWRVIASTVLTAIGVVIMTFYVVNEPQRMVEFTEGFEGRSIENGAAIYANNCATCHNERGEGIPGRGPAIARSDLFDGTYIDSVGWGSTTYDFIYDTVAAGRPMASALYVDQNYAERMPTWSQEFGGPMREDQVRDVVAYVMNLGKGDVEPTVIERIEPVGISITDPELPEGDVENGEKLVQKLGCIGCHVGGSANDVAPAWLAAEHPDGVGIGARSETAYTAADYGGAATNAVEYLRESIVQPNVYLISGWEAGVMPQNYGTDLLDAQMLADIIAYLQTLE